MRVGVLLIVAGCGRVAFEPARTTDGSTDGSTDGACTWGPWSAPARLAAPVTSTFDEWSPTLFDGDRKMVFHRYENAGSLGDLYIASRATTNAPFGDVTELAELNDNENQWTPTLTDDGLVIVLAENPVVDFDLYQATRATTTSAWSAKTELATLTSNTDETEPFLFADGLAMIFSSKRGGGFALYETTRTSRTAQFAAPMRLELAGDAQDPTLSADGLELVFASSRAGGLGMLDLWTTRRTARDQPFATPTPVLDLSSARDDVGPEMSRDGTTLFFNRDTLVEGSGDADLWSSTRACE